MSSLLNGITPDGTAVVFHEVTPTMGVDLLQLALDGTHRVTPLLQTKFDERNGIVSPDGRWLAYESNSSGSVRNLRPALSERRRRPVASLDGGGQRSRSGRGAARNCSMSVPTGRCCACRWRRAARPGTPARRRSSSRRRYYTGGGASGGRTYDVSPDGQRFLMIKAPATDAGAAPPALIVVQHWDEELKRLVPTK